MSEDWNAERIADDQAGGMLLFVAALMALGVVVLWATGAI